MPKLIFSSEKFGCGATIQLDNDEICLISVAQAGVLVRSYPSGFLKRLFGSLRGPILYNEKNVSKAVKTAMVLAAQFPERHPSLKFQDQVLAAFANAVWRCSSAAEVSLVLNDAEMSASSRTISELSRNLPEAM